MAISLPDLPDSVAREVFATFCTSLPRPVPDTPEARAARAESGLAAVAALYPTDAFEARHAAAIVTAEAWYQDTLRLAGERGDDFAGTMRCRAQANSLLREMRNHLREYRRMQAERDKGLAEMHPATMGRAGWWFHEASVPAPEKPADPAETPSTVAPERDFASFTPAEQYAVIYPARARLIRAGGGLPARLDFGPPDPDIVQDLVHGASPIIRALDERDVPAHERPSQKTPPRDDAATEPGAHDRVVGQRAIHAP